MNAIVRKTVWCLAFVAILLPVILFDPEKMNGKQLIDKIEQFRKDYNQLPHYTTFTGTKAEYRQFQFDSIANEQQLPFSMFEIGEGTIWHSWLFYAKLDADNYLVWYCKGFDNYSYYSSNTEQWVNGLNIPDFCQSESKIIPSVE